MTGSHITLHEGGLADLEAVMRVMDASFDPEFGEAWTASQCASLLPLAGVWLTLARDAERTVGFALARIISGEAELLLLAVHRDFQGRGIGNKLVDHFIATAESRGADRLHLEVRDRHYAVELYKRAGFQIVGRRTGYYRGHAGQVHDALTLAKDRKSGR